MIRRTYLVQFEYRDSGYNKRKGWHTISVNSFFPKDPVELIKQALIESGNVHDKYTFDNTYIIDFKRIV